MPLRGFTRKRVLAGSAVLVPCVVAAITLTILTRPSAGQLQHDDTFRTTKVSEQWRVVHAEHGHCLVIRFSGTVSGNARPTWGFGGPTTVWENLRLHGGNIGVEARELRPDGECGDRTEMRRVTVAQQWKTGDGDWRGIRQTRVTSGRGSSVSNGYSATTIRLAGGAYDRDETYRTTLGVYVEPTWSTGNGGTSESVTVEDDVELPVD